MLIISFEGSSCLCFKALSLTSNNYRSREAVVRMLEFGIKLFLTYFFYRCTLLFTPLLDIYRYFYRDARNGSNISNILTYISAYREYVRTYSKSVLTSLTFIPNNMNSIYLNIITSAYTCRNNGRTKLELCKEYHRSFQGC